MYLEKGRTVFTLSALIAIKCLHHSVPRTHREADDGLSSSLSAISVSFMFCETCLKTLNKPLEERDKTVLFREGTAHDARPNFLITRRRNKTLNESLR